MTKPRTVKWDKNKDVGKSGLWRKKRRDSGKRRKSSNKQTKRTEP